jgi:multidrug resistance protein MdtO
MIGVFLGVALSTVIHTYLWPEAEGEALRQRIARLLHGIGEQLRSGLSAPAPVGLWADLGDVEAMAARVALEPGWQMGEGQNEGFMLSIQSLLARIREILLAADALGAERRSLRLGARAESAAVAFQSALAASLDGYARDLAEHPAAIAAPRLVALDALSAGCRDDLLEPPNDARQAACDRLLAAARKLADDISGLPAWMPDHVAPALTSRASQA